MLTNIKLHLNYLSVPGNLSRPGIIDARARYRAAARRLRNTAVEDFSKSLNEELRTT